MANTASKPGVGSGVAVASTTGVGVAGTAVSISTIASSVPYAHRHRSPLWGHALIQYLLFIQFETFYSREMANISGKQYGVVRNRNTGDECISELNKFPFSLQIRQNLTC